MRIVLATPLYPPDIGGPATYCKLLEEEFPQQGIEVEVVAFAQVRGMPRIIRHIAYFVLVKRALRKAEVVLALDPVSVGLPVCLACWGTGKPFFLKIVGDYAWEQGRQRFGVSVGIDEFILDKNIPFVLRILRYIQVGVASRAKHILVPSQYLKKIIGLWGIPLSKIEVIYNSVSLETNAEVLPEMIAKLPRPRVVTAGRLVPWKHMDGVIDAVARVRMNGVNASLVIVGEGPLEEKLRAQARQKLGTSCVMPGKLTHAETLTVIKDADVFVLNSSYEGLSHVLIEAQILATPTIATEVGGNPEVIFHGKNGLLVPPENVSALASSLEDLLKNTQLRSVLADGARKLSSRFSVDEMITKTANVVSKSTP